MTKWPTRPTPSEAWVAPAKAAVIKTAGSALKKGHAGTTAILTRVEAKYGMTRTQVNNGTTTPVTFPSGDTLNIPVEGARAGRAEIINRTGPTAFREALRTPTNSVANQLPDGLVNASVYTTSWTTDMKLGAQKNLAAEWGTMPGAMPTAAGLKLASSQSADNATLAAPTLPVADTLTVQERDAISLAVKKGVTVLGYTSQNEGGRLDMNHCKFALRGLPEAHRTIALDAIVRTFNDPAMKGTADKVGCVIMPTHVHGASNNIPVATETLDRLFDVGNPVFQNAPMINGTIQHAALHGDLRTLKFAVDYGHLDAANLHTDSLYSFDAGKHNSDFVGKKMDPMTAAIYGGQHEALGYLLNVGPANATHLTTASKLGAITPMLTMMDDGVAVNQNGTTTIGNAFSAVDSNVMAKELGLEAASSSIRQNGTIALLNKHLSLGDAAATKNIAINEVAAGAVMKGDMDVLNHMTAQLGVTAAEIHTKLPTIAEPRAASLQNLGAQATSPADTAFVLEIASTDPDKLEVQNGALKAGNLDMVNACLNEGRPLASKIDLSTGAPDAAAVSAIAHAKYPDVEAIKNDWQGVDINTLTKGEAQELTLKGLAYSETRVAAGHTGRASRVQGWDNLMQDINNKFPSLTADNLRLNQASQQSGQKLNQLAGTHQTVRAALGRAANRVQAAVGHGHGHGH